MATQNEDRRVRKTKKQLRGALTSLLLEKDISRITVRDVAELADVNRGTFYAHYSDVHDLLGQLESELMEHLEEQFIRIVVLMEIMQICSSMNVHLMRTISQTVGEQQ